MSIDEVILIRHGEAEHNIGLASPGPKTYLTETGRRQAARLYDQFSREWLLGAAIYCSTHTRCMQTLDGLLGDRTYLKPRYDPLLREVEYGRTTTYAEAEAEMKCEERKQIGKFYYRFKNGGESPADCYDRMCLFMESAHRECKRNNHCRLLVVSHGMTVRCLILRWMHWHPDVYEQMDNVGHCQPVFLRRENKGWKVEGMNLR